MRSAGFQRQFSTKGQGGCDYVWTDQSAVVLMSRPWGDACGHPASPCLHTLSPTPLLRVFQPAIWTPPGGQFCQILFILSCYKVRGSAHSSLPPWWDPATQTQLPASAAFLPRLSRPSTPQACFASHRLQNHLGRAAALGPTAAVCLFPPHV